MFLYIKITQKPVFTSGRKCMYNRFVRKINKNIAATLMLLAVLLPTTKSVFAQETETNFGVAYPVEITLKDGQEIENGMIISHKNGEYQLSSEAYDRSIIGSINLFPRIEFINQISQTGNTITQDGETPIISSGTSPVLVSGESGPITKGNLVTASSIAGIGMKAVKSGFTLGIAMQNFDGTTADDRGLIDVRIAKDFTFGEDTPDSETIGNRLRDVVSLSAIAAIDDPKEMFKYLLAGIILLTSVTIAFVSFSRTSQKGIEALGRNPLARSSIMTGIFVNILISVTIIGAGIAGAYFVVTL